MSGEKLTTFYEAKCAFCGEDVGLPEDARGFFGFVDVTYYPPNSSEGVHIIKDEESPGDRTVHEECWMLYWDGSTAGSVFYEKEE